MVSRWWFKLWKQDYTITYDMSPFLPEQLIHVKGSVRAWWFAHKWVADHPFGQAQVLKGKYWQGNLLDQL